MTRDNSIGLLRLLLAAGVLWGHSWYLAGRSSEEPISKWLFGGSGSPAGIGVEGFFVLSGYLVMFSENRLHSTRRFLWHRLLRIYPGLWACLLVTGVGLPALWSAFSPLAIDWKDAFGYVARNAILMRQQLAVRGFCENVPLPGDLNGSLWTLPYELGCYAVLAFLGWLGFTKPRSWTTRLAGGAILLLYVHDTLRVESAVFFKTPGRALSIWFVLGALAASIPEEKLQRVIRWPVVLGATIVYLMACRIGGMAFVAPVSISVVVLGLIWLLPVHHFERKVRGDYSYGLYIYAYPMQQMLAAAGLLERGMATYIAVVALSTVVLAILSWHLVEKHALALKSIAAPARAAPVGAVCTETGIPS